MSTYSVPHITSGNVYAQMNVSQYLSHILMVEIRA